MTEPTAWDTWKTTVAFIVWVAGLLALFLTIGHPLAHSAAMYFAGGANAVLIIRIVQWAKRALTDAA